MGMSAKAVKCYVGNYDGRRAGMIYATSKREAAKVAGCSVYHFERQWGTGHAPLTATMKAGALYTRKNDYRSDWQEGICPP